MGQNESKENNKKNNKNNTTTNTNPPHELKTTVMIIQSRINQNKNKTIADIKQKREAAVKLLKENKKELCKLKIESIMRSEDLVSCYELIHLLLDTLKDKISYIWSSKDICPNEFSAALETVLYSSTRMNVEEFTSFREMIVLKFGKNYVNDAVENKNKLVNINMITRLSISPYSDKAINERIRILAQEEDIGIFGYNAMMNLKNSNNVFSNQNNLNIIKNDDNNNYKPPMKKGSDLTNNINSNNQLDISDKGLPSFPEFSDLMNGLKVDSMN
jgi:hypothetical protein